MTQTLANRMTKDTDQVFVACNPLQPQETMLESSLMAETYGGVVVIIPPLVAAAKAVAPFAAGAAFGFLANYLLHHVTSEASGCDCNVEVNINVDCGG